MPTKRLRWINIFKAGTLRDKSGRSQTYTPDHVRQMAKNFNPDHYKPPLILTHDVQGEADQSLWRNKALSFGTPAKVRVHGGKLQAGFDQDHLAPQFTELVKNRQVLAVSPGLYGPNHPANPNPGQWTLRHIAALGAEPPAIKGLGGLDDLVVDFAEDDSDEIYEFDDGLPLFEEELEPIYQERPMALEKILLGAIQALAASQNKTPNLPEGDLADYSEGDWQRLWEQVQPPPQPEFSETEQRLQEQLAAANQLVAEREAQLRERDLASFVEPLVGAGKVLPGEAKGLTRCLADLSDSQVYEFSEGIESSPHDFLKTFLEQLPRRIEFGEVSAEAGDLDEALPEFAEAPGYSASAEKKELYRKAAAYAKKNDCDMITAYKAVGGK